MVLTLRGLYGCMQTHPHTQTYNTYICNKYDVACSRSSNKSRVGMSVGIRSGVCEWVRKIFYKRWILKLLQV